MGLFEDYLDEPDDSKCIFLPTFRNAKKAVVTYKNNRLGQDVVIKQAEDKFLYVIWGNGSLRISSDSREHIINADLVDNVEVEYE